MEEMWVRGIFFYQVLKYIQEHKGKSIYDLMGAKIEDYRADKKYDFGEFCDLLARADMVAGEDNTGFVSQMSKETMEGEAKWKMLFRRMDPRNIFTSTKRQEGRHNVANFQTLEERDGFVEIEMRMLGSKASHQILWADFYKGRLEGILSLMGKRGTVKIERGKEGVFFYLIKWK